MRFLQLCLMLASMFEVVIKRSTVCRHSELTGLIHTLCEFPRHGVWLDRIQLRDTETSRPSKKRVDNNIETFLGFRE